jgi:glycosyltransferase involved in cell wall biosynthesis
MNTDPRPRLKVVICWTQISGYFAACWRQLSAMPQIDLLVVAFAENVRATSTDFDNSLVADLNCRLLSPTERHDVSLVRSLVVDFKPDVVYLAGWAIPAYVRLAHDPALAHCHFMMYIDTQWRGTLRQRLGRFKIGRFLARLDRVVVPGERSFHCARRLGIAEAKIRRGAVGFDYDLIEPALASRLRNPAGWPRRFLFAGRYVKDKALDVLMQAYTEYRRGAPEPWPLACCGVGPYGGLIRGTPGVEDLGFVQPGDLPRVFADHGVFVLASRHEPWGLVVAEAAAAGLPVVCTEACGAGPDVVRPLWNGITVATNDPSLMAAALRWCHDHHALLPAMGQRGQSLAAAYSAQAWANRIVNYIHELRSDTKA